MNRQIESLVKSAGFAALVGTFVIVHAQSGPVTAHDAWMREPAPSRDVTAVFVVVENHGRAPRAIVSATSEAAEKVELHEMKNENGMMRMSPVKEIALPVGVKTELKPGGLHLMLFGLKQRPQVGANVAVILTLDDGTTIPVVATVRKQESPQ